MEKGRRSHPHGHAGATHHDEHIRHHEDRNSKTHLETAVDHLHEHKGHTEHHMVEQHHVMDLGHVPPTPSQPSGGMPKVHDPVKDHPGV